MIEIALTSMISPVLLVILTVKTAPAGLRSALMIAIFRPVVVRVDLAELDRTLGLIGLQFLSGLHVPLVRLPVGSLPLDEL
jgi:hypothetical protein